MSAKPPHLLLVQALFYEHIAADLRRGAERAVTEAGATCETVSVPGAFEVPDALPAWRFGQSHLLTQLSERLARVFFQRRQDLMVNFVHIVLYSINYADRLFYDITVSESNSLIAIPAIVAKMTPVTPILVPLPAEVA